jgi:hypothetical protein
MNCYPQIESVEKINLSPTYRLSYYHNLRGYVLQKKCKFLKWYFWKESAPDNVYFSDPEMGIVYFNKYIEKLLP